MGVGSFCQVDHGRLLLAKKVARFDRFIELVDGRQLRWLICIINFVKLHDLRGALGEASLAS